uniref:Uncharacterized protein LOC117351819 n=1 Tax=Geotrypetes seraphini TaxID=260995 RepID=A0A6P8Q8R3_GEOSA|nr:uncharacterized protein LOC117351819 [Geotrypetes seraphini]
MKTFKCPEGPNWLYWDQHCYYLENKYTKTWMEALKDCKRYSNTELMKIDSLAEKASLTLVPFKSAQAFSWILFATCAGHPKDWMLLLPLEDYWIGMNNFADVNFTWSEGSPVDNTWLQLSNILPEAVSSCIKVTPTRQLLAVACVERAKWICKRSADAERYQRFESRILLYPAMHPAEVHKELSTAKSACLSLTHSCSGITTWNNSYVLVEGTSLLESEEPNAFAYVKSDCSMGFSGKNCSSVCKVCFGDILCNPLTGDCNDVLRCQFQDAPASCRTGLKSLKCPPYAGWWYREPNCYFFSSKNGRSWLEARNACRQYNDADLLWIESRDELNWLLSKVLPGVTWTGLNNRKLFFSWQWANEKSASNTLKWLKLFGSPGGRCAGIDRATGDVVKFPCEKSYRWACKKREAAGLFEMFPDRYIMKPFASLELFSNLANAQLACALQQNCTAVVQIQDFFRLLAGHDEIRFTPDSRDPAATVYIKRICTPGFFGDYCSRVCILCHGDIPCNSVTGGCPELFTCLTKTDSELCEKALTSVKCPQNPLWYYWNGNCYYIEKTMTRTWEEARRRCVGYHNSSLMIIHSEDEMIWLASMVTANVWLGLSKVAGVWTWSTGHAADVTPRWFLSIRSAPGPCAQLRQEDASLLATECNISLSWVCEKKADLDMFLVYPGKLLLSLSLIAEYTTLDEAKHCCIVNPICKGIASWPDRHALVFSTEMVTAGSSNTVYLKTNCASGYYGLNCSNVCSPCYTKEPCNSLTGLCDDAASCSRTDTLVNCARSVVSVKCPNAAGWMYWKQNCYYIATAESKNWHDAFSACSHYRNSALVWLEDAEELAWLSSLVTANSWTGLQDLNGDHIWTWSFGEDATSAMAWLTFQKREKLKRCTEVIPKGAKIYSALCQKANKWTCKKAADLEMYAVVWDAVMLSMLSIPNVTYTDESMAREACLFLRSKCAGFALWTGTYLLMSKAKLILSEFEDGVAYIKSVCNFQFYGVHCENKCPHCYWDRPCNAITGHCEDSVVCAKPESKGVCELGQYSFRCPLDASWYYWNGWCYKVEMVQRASWQEARAACGRFNSTRLLQLDSAEEKAWVEKMVSGPAWIGISRDTPASPWKWSDGSIVSESKSWLRIDVTAAGNCALISNRPELLQAKICSTELPFVCERSETVDMFRSYPGDVVTLRENLLPVTYSSLESAKAACLYEKDHCTGVVSSENKYILVSGSEVVRSTGQVHNFYPKLGCKHGYFDKQCQTVCSLCRRGLHCHVLTGACVDTAKFTCTLQSLDPRCSAGKVLSDLCPFRPKWHYFQSACYYVENQANKTWHEAREWCRGFKETDLIVINSTLEKMWALSQNVNSWIGLTYVTRKSSYVWINGTVAEAQSSRIFNIGSPILTKQKSCVTTFGNFLVLDVCSSLWGWICKRAEAITKLYTEYSGKSLYTPRVPKANIYRDLEAAKNVCSVMWNCTGVVLTKWLYVLHTSTVLFNSWKGGVSTLLKTDCQHGRYGAQCENTCPKCLHSSPCNGYSGLCSDYLYCSSESQTLISCESGYIYSGKCPTEPGWWYWHGSCYYFQTTKKTTWMEAEQLCTQYRDAHLLWIESTEEKEWLLTKTTETTTWSGLSGHKHCSVLAWSYSKYPYTGAAWLPVHKKTRKYMCCAHFAGSDGSLTAVGCSQKHPWICKRKEEAVDILQYVPYYLVEKATLNSSIPSLQEALRLCRSQRSLCNGILKHEKTHRTMLASQIFQVKGYTGPAMNAYLKSACTPGYYGPECRETCVCNDPENCNPFTGECVGILQCLLQFVQQKCQRGVLSLKCPRDPGWWYWNATCYYIEARNATLSWEEAKGFCSAYNGTDLLQLDSEAEKAWVSSMLNGSVWIDISTLGLHSAPGKSKKTPNTLKTANGKANKCFQLDVAGTVRQVDCLTLSPWVCERKEGDSMFWKYPGRVLLHPWEQLNYSSLEFAQSACLLNPNCTGVTEWKKRYTSVLGTQLVNSVNRQNTAYLFSACSEGRYGRYCQEKCPQCLGKLVCNKITGQCDSRVTCQERRDLKLCDYRLISSHCFASWRYWNGSCYYFAPYVLKWREAHGICGKFKGAQLLKLNSTKEQIWAAQVLVRSSWIGLRYNISTGLWIWADDEEAAPSWDLINVTDYLAVCVQMMPGTGGFIASHCTKQAQWICKASQVPGALESAHRWWSSVLLSVLIAVFVVVITMLATYGTVYWQRKSEHEQQESQTETSSMAEDFMMEER